MTEAECKMMDTIHLYGLIFSMNDNDKDQVLDRMEEVLRNGSP